eukprot:1338949-Amorphochlora_amoeboformis.AAC.1
MRHPRGENMRELRGEVIREPDMGMGRRRVRFEGSPELMESVEPVIAIDYKNAADGQTIIKVSLSIQINRGNSRLFPFQFLPSPVVPKHIPLENPRHPSLTAPEISHELMLRHAPGVFGFASKCELDTAADHCVERGANVLVVFLRIIKMLRMSLSGLADGDEFCKSG